jgi:glycosyltransferase involved in cell wall biosynthesis
MEERRRDPQEAEPLASVVIPCWNQAHFLGEAIESVLAQTYSPVEILVVDDGSVDNSGQVARRYPNVDYRHQPNRGPAAARNAGLSASRGEYVVFLDADDRLLPCAIEVGMEALRRAPGTALAVGACQDIDPAGRSLGTSVQPLIHRDHYVALLKSCFIHSGSSVVFTRWCLEAVSGFDERFRTGDDYDLYLRLAHRYSLLCHGRVVTEYRRHAFSLTGDPSSTLSGELAALRAQRRAARGRRERSALRAGRRRARRTHAVTLTRRLSEQLQRREWSRAAQSASALLRNRPAALARVLAELWRSKGLPSGVRPASLAPRRG